MIVHVALPIGSIMVRSRRDRSWFVAVIVARLIMVRPRSRMVSRDARSELHTGCDLEGRVKIVGSPW